MNNKNKSFTLIELLVVIVIIGILAGVIMISTTSSIDKANLAKAQAFSSTIQNELLSNLVSEWTFDEGSNQTVNRIATNDDVKDTWGSNHGTINGDPILKGDDDCVFGKCVSFDGNDYINTGYKGIETIQNALTIETWFNSDTYTVSNDVWHDNHVIVYLTSSGNGLPDGQNMLYIGFYQNNFRTRYCALFPEEIVWKHDLSMNKWHHVVYALNFPHLKLYIDGKLFNSNDNVQNLLSVVPNTKSIRIGNWSSVNDTYFKGKIDDTRIYNDSISSAQIKQNYIAGLDSLLSKNLISKEEYNQRIKGLSSK
ncbi:MAG: LamG-like jellyroll fold domain-containing protein [Minisyncoccales bacterium]